MHRVTLIRGDGIGPEIIEATVRVLQAAGVVILWEDQAAGAEAVRRCGHPLPEPTVKNLQDTRIALKGPLIVDRGSPPVTVASLGETYATPNAALRGVCRAFVNVRPVRRFLGVPTRYPDATIDFVIVREVSEGIYVGREREVEPGRAEAVLVTTREASERVTRFAMHWLGQKGRKRITAVHKANVLDRTDGLFLRTVYETCREFPDIPVDDLLIDAAAARMVLDPAWFDVIVAPNQYGDILSDLGAAVGGGLGLGPGANFGDASALFEACHGAAPDIAGRDMANPIAMILSGVMMLEHLGEVDAARQIDRAVMRFLASGKGLTPDLGGDGTTRSVADRIVALLESSHD